MTNCGNSLAKSSDGVRQPSLEAQAEPLSKKPRSLPTRRPPETQHSSGVSRSDGNSLLLIPVLPCIAVTLKVGLLAGAAAWACKQFCPRQTSGFLRVPAPWAAPMGLPHRGCYISVGDGTEVHERVPPKECTAAVSETPKKARPLLAPLQILGGAVKERLATLTSASTRASSRRSVCSDDEDIYRLASHDDEEARCLLWGNSRQPVEDADEEEDEAALSALLKLRPSLADSLGDEADNDSDEGFAGPLVGNGRMSLLSR